MNFFCPNCTHQLASAFVAATEDAPIPDFMRFGIRCRHCKTNWVFVAATGKVTYATKADLKKKLSPVDNMPKPVDNMPKPAV